MGQERLPNRQLDAMNLRPRTETMKMILLIVVCMWKCVFGQTSSVGMAFGDLYDGAAFSMTLALGAVAIPLGNGKSRAKRAYSISMCLINGDERARLAVSGSSSSNAYEIRIFRKVMSNRL